MRHCGYLNPGIYVESTLQQGMREAVRSMSKPNKTILGQIIDQTRRRRQTMTKPVPQQVSWINGIRHVNGVAKPLLTTYVQSPQTSYCDETKKWYPKERLETVANKKYLVRHGLGQLSFITIHKNDFTIAHIYKKDGKGRDWISTKRYAGELGWKRVRELLFDNSIHVADAKKKLNLPFKTIHKQAIMPMDKFEQEFEPNEEIKKSYTSTGKDTALTSLSSILEENKSTKMRAGTFAAAISQVNKAVALKRNSYTGKLPAISVHAIWCNFDPESKLISKLGYDVGEPMLYQYEVMK